MGENNFRICEEVQQMQDFVAEGKKEGTKKEILKLTSWGMNAYESDLITAQLKNTTVNTQG